MRFFFIWEQDSTYQSYIRPHWGKYNILTIISDQFEAIAYQWEKTLPKEMHPYFKGAWMKANILNNHGPLCSLYKAHGKEDKDFEEGDFRSEGDSPAFIHMINTGLRNLEKPQMVDGVAVISMCVKTPGLIRFRSPVINIPKEDGTQNQHEEAENVGLSLPS